MVTPKEYEEIWNKADELAQKEAEETTKNLSKEERRDFHIQKMLEFKN